MAGEVLTGRNAEESDEDYADIECRDIAVLVFVVSR